MRTLAVLPDKTGYSAKPGAAFGSKTFAGSPASRFAARPGSEPDVLECTWVLTPGEYTYLRAFYRTATALGSLPFEAMLAVDGAELLPYQALIVPGSFGLRSVSGEEHRVSATLVASRAPTGAGDDYDAIVAVLLGEYGGEDGADGALALFGQLANEDLRT